MPYYEPPKEWKETIEGIPKNDAFHDNCRLFELLNQVKEELGRST
jgi:hypothetical protein